MIYKIDVMTRIRTEFVYVTSQIQEVVKQSEVKEGICYLYVPHTTAAIKGQEVPIFIAGEDDGTFDSHDYLEFHGKFNRGTYSRFGEYTIQNVYWLTWGGARGARMALKDSTSQNFPKAETPQFYKATLHYEEDNIRGGLGYVDEKRDVWFWRSINAPCMMISMMRFCH